MDMNFPTVEVLTRYARQSLERDRSLAIDKKA